MDGKLTRAIHAICATLLIIGLCCLAQAAIFSTSHISSGGQSAVIWSTTAAPSNPGNASTNQTWVSKWITTASHPNPLNTPPGGNQHLQLTFKTPNVQVTLSELYVGGGQTLAAQCSGTLRVWNFASTPTYVLSLLTLSANTTYTTPSFLFPTWPGVPFIVSINLSSGGPLPIITPTGTVPASDSGNFLSYFLASSHEAGTQCKSTGYSTPFTNQIRFVTGITSLP